MAPLLPLFRTGGIRAVFSGHEHNFQHSHDEGIDYFITGAGSKVLTLKSKEQSHLSASILVLTTPYFAIPDGSGKYAIPNVAAGEYKVRVYYKDGWVEGFEEKVVVKDKDTPSKNVDLKSLDTEAADGGTAEGQ